VKMPVRADGIQLFQWECIIPAIAPKRKYGSLEASRIPSALTGILTLFLLAVFFTYRHILPGFYPEFWSLQSAVAAAVIVGL
ncbi:hypothetical protein ACC785_38205, partial [Rhizobium ruizarguesonis]